MAILIVPFFSSITPEGLKTPILEKLRIDGVEVILPADFAKRGRADGPSREPIYILVGSGGSENLIDSFVAETDIEPPVLLLSHSLNNSLPAAMETRASMEQQGIKSRIIHGSIDDLTQQLKKRVHFASIIDRIRRSKLGIIGKPSQWLIASNVDDSAVSDRWGLKIERYQIDLLISHMTDEMDEESKTRFTDFIHNSSCNDIPEEDVEKAARVAHQVAKIVNSENLDAVTVECFELLMQTSISGCYALSTLNERDLFVAGCEGDIPSTFTMLVAKLLSGNPVFMANVADIDASSNKATFAHCTLPTSLTKSYRIMTHYETGLSLGVRGSIENQRVTVLKVSGDDLSRFWVSGGMITENPENNIACRTQIRIEMDEPVTYFLEKSLANHHIVMLGDYAEQVRDFFSYSIDGW